MSHLEAYQFDLALAGDQDILHLNTPVRDVVDFQVSQRIHELTAAIVKQIREWAQHHTSLNYFNNPQYRHINSQCLNKEKKMFLIASCT